ncbi:MAG: lipoate--protein ligase [Bacteroidetes bacterium]|nr:MAG: lipoate--protein ligase [Bacteroidota bacterium]
MLCISSPFTDPYFNLASEEFLLKHYTDAIFLLYRNQPAIVIGKHQNALAEINLEYVRTNRIAVARRISGGGAVYHDPGNVNFAFITTGREGELVDYRKYTAPVISALWSLGLEVRMGDRHELLLNGLKISGTASHVFKHRVLHHGTLLFSARMDALSGSLRAGRSHFLDRAVHSIPSRVTNIRDHLVEKIDVKDFQAILFRHILMTMEDARPHHYSEQDLNSIQNLRDSRYSTWEWNFGYSPRYEFSKSHSSGAGKFTLHMNVEKGIIRQINIEGEFSGDAGILQEFITGTIHDPETIRTKLSEIRVGDYINGLENEDLIALMF